MSASLGIVEIAAVKKAAKMVSHQLLTGPGSGAGTVDKPIKTSRIPGIERSKQYIDAKDAMHFADEVLKRAAASNSQLGMVAADDRERAVAAVGALMFGLPQARVDLALALDVELNGVV